MSKVSDYAFINAKLRARIGIMRDTALFDEMIKSPSLTEAFAKLDGTRHQDLLEVYRKTGDLQQVELEMLEDEISIYREVESYLPTVPSSFISVLLEKIEVDNLRVSFNLDNAFTISGWRRSDPVMKLISPRIWTFGVNMTL